MLRFTTTVCNAGSFDAWQASGRNTGRPEWLRDKTGFCLMDLLRVSNLPRSPSSPVYSTQCNSSIQGISVGWGDVYLSGLSGQLIDLGSSPLPDGQYVLRSVADPMMLIRESESGADPSRGGEVANAAQVVFTIQAGRIGAVAR